MKNLTLGDLAKLVDYCTEKNIPLDTPVFLGDDDELNVVHTAWHSQAISKNNEDDKYFFKLIETNRGNVETKDVNILIS